MEEKFTFDGFEPKKCPICEGEMLGEDQIDYLECSNDCILYEFDPLTGNATVISNLDKKIFYNVDFFNEKKQPSVGTVELIKSIEYWRKNDRYLMKIMTKE
ncbi:hypothetical protein D3C87_76520 [compost metagenome]